MTLEVSQLLESKLSLPAVAPLASHSPASGPSGPYATGKTRCPAGSGAQN